MGENEVPQSRNFDFPTGEHGNLLTVEFMKRLAVDRAKHPAFRQLATTIFNSANIPSMHYVKEALALGRFVQSNIRYVRDIAGVETIIDPLTMLDQLKRGVASGDCDDHSLFLATLLIAVGHRPYFRIIKYRLGNPSYNHIYVVDYARDGKSTEKRVVLDTILKKQTIGFEVPHAEGQEISVLK